MVTRINFLEGEAAELVIIVSLFLTSLSNYSSSSLSGKLGIRVSFPVSFSSIIAKEIL